MPCPTEPAPRSITGHRQGAWYKEAPGACRHRQRSSPEVLTMSDSAQEMPFDAAKAEAFAGSLVQALNHAAWCLMASIGHRTGLFDAMRGLPKSTAADIARAAGLNERYVREWL